MNRLIMFVSVCVVLCGQSALAQKNFAFPLAASDGASTSQVTIGVNTSATDCIDPSLSELELPPLPPAGIFDFRSVPFKAHGCFGQGMTIDIRHLVADTQSDTFVVRFQPSTEATRTSMLLSWPSNLDSMGGGRWVLRDMTGGTILNVDMTKVDSVAVDLELEKVMIIKTDSASFRTFTAASLVTDVDNFGKTGKYVKPTPYKTDFSLRLNSGTATTITTLHVEWAVGILTGALTITPTPASVTPDAKFMKYDIRWTTPLAPSTIVTITGVANKGKLQTAKYWWLAGTIISGVKMKTDPLNFNVNILRLPMPNSYNAGYEMMASLYPKGTFLRIGTTIPRTLGYVHSVVHQTYPDVIKSLYKKNFGYHVGTSSCFDYFDKAGVRNIKAPFKKEVKTLAPDKQNNALFGEALVLKVNLGMSQTLNTPLGLNSLIVRDTTVFNGATIGQIASEVDTLLSCGPITTSARSSTTLGEYLTVVRAINQVFAGAPIDTISFGNGSKLGDVKFKGGVYVADINWLERPLSAVPEYSAAQSAAAPLVPQQYSLEQNYPNPFNPTTTIRFILPAESRVSITIFDLLGREVGLLADHQLYQGGMNEVQFNASSLASGVYLYRLAAYDAASGAMTFHEVRKMTLIK